MRRANMCIFLILVTVLWIRQTTCTVVGVSYLNDHNFDKSQKPKPGEDPCNPLYWYPRPIPEYCLISTPRPRPSAVVVPAPMPVPIPVQPLQFPVIPPMPVLPPMPVPIPPPFPSHPIPFPIAPPFLPHPIQLYRQLPIPPMPSQPIHPRPPIDVEPPKPLPFGMPMMPAMPIPPRPPPPYFPSSLHQPSIPYGLPNTYGHPGLYGPSNIYTRRQQIGMVPGLPGLISPDGGINILPFSDAYADMFELYKQKMITKRLQKMVGDYKTYPWERWTKRRRKRRLHGY